VIVPGPAKRTNALVLHERPEGFGHHARAPPGLSSLATRTSTFQGRPGPPSYHGLVILRAARAPRVFLALRTDLLALVASLSSISTNLNKTAICLAGGERLSRPIEICLPASGRTARPYVTTVQKCQFDAGRRGPRTVDQRRGLVSGNW